jgi:hypothetical protein
MIDLGQGILGTRKVGRRPSRQKFHHQQNWKVTGSHGNSREDPAGAEVLKRSEYELSSKMGMNWRPGVCEEAGVMARKETDGPEPGLRS